MKRTKWLALFAVLALVLAACGSGDDEGTDTTEGGDGGTATTADSGDGGTATTEDGGDGGDGGMAGEGGELILLQWQAPSQANPYLSTGTKDIQAGSLVLEPLAEYNTVGEVVPALAAEIPTVDNGGISEDLTSITWTLQEGVVWSDGTPLTAADVVFSWEYCTSEGSGCISSAFSNVASVEAVDELNVTVTFNGPTPWPFVPFVGATEPVIQAAQFADCLGEAALSCTDQNFMPIGTGPYMVTELRPEDTVLYEYNPNYRLASEGKPFFGTVTLKGGGDAEASARSVLEIGEADYAWNLQVAPEILDPMEAAGNGVVAVGFNTSVEHINLNQTDPDDPDCPSDAECGSPNPYFFNNAEFARALSLAINRDEIVAVGYGAAGEPTCNMWPVPGDALSTNNDWCLTQDVDEAISILDGLGYVDSDGDGVREFTDGTPLEFDYVTSTNAVRQSTQELVKKYWADVGIATNMQNEDASLFFDGTGASPVNIWSFFTDIQMFTNSATGADAQTYFQGWQSDQIPTASNGWGGNNIVRLQSDEYDSIFAELEQTSLTDPNRPELIKQLNDIISSGGSTIPLVNRGSVSAFSNTLDGYVDVNGWDSEYWNIEEWYRK